MMKMNRIEKKLKGINLSSLIEDEEDVDSYHDEDDEYYEECIFNL